MNLPQEYLRLRQAFEHAGLCLGRSEINLFRPDSLAQNQIGYQIDDKGQSPMHAAKQRWEATWLIIGNDDTGDPIFIDTREPALPVFIAAEGEGAWSPDQLTPSLQVFFDILHYLKPHTEGRENIEGFEKKPIDKKERQTHLAAIEQLAGSRDGLTYWEVWLEGGI